MTARQCSTPGCTRYSTHRSGLCGRCRKAVPPSTPEPKERNLNRCTLCGEEFANRGLLKIHVDRTHAPEE